MTTAHIRLIAPHREDIAATIAYLTRIAGDAVQFTAPRAGRRGAWLVYGTITRDHDRGWQQTGEHDNGTPVSPR